MAQISTGRKLELGGSGSSRAGERDASRNAARGSGDPRRAVARGYSHVRHVSASRAAGSTRDALASRDRRDSRFGSASLRALRLSFLGTDLRAARRFREKKSETLSRFDPTASNRRSGRRHTRARDRFRQTRRTLSVASGARSARAITDRRVSRRGAKRATHAALSKRSRARRFPEKKGIIVVKRRGVPSRAGRDA